LPDRLIDTAPAETVVTVVVPEKLAAFIAKAPPTCALPTARAPEPPPMLTVVLPAADNAVKVTVPVVEVEASRVKAPSTNVLPAL